MSAKSGDRKEAAPRTRVRADVLMIGSATRHVGKTEFACAVIRNHIARGPVAAIKVTTIRGEHACPHDNADCGVCGSLTGDYTVSLETGDDGNKDTCRLRAAGASPVYWLRVRHEHLREGLADVLGRIPPGLPVICESNSARAFLEPGAFLVIRKKGMSGIKASCAEGLDLADRIVEFDGSGWDFKPADVTFARGRWWIRQEAAAIILAGGRSRRMGQDKSLLLFNGKPMIQHIGIQLEPLFREWMIGSNDPRKFSFLNVPIVPDREPDMGPLMGILSCLAATRYEDHFITACDVPDIHLEFIRQMLASVRGYDAVVPLSPDGRPEPLFAVYTKAVIGPAEKVLRQGGRRIVDLLKLVKVLYLPLPDTGWYRNLNTMEEYVAARPSGETG